MSLDQALFEVAKHFGIEAAPGALLGGLEQHADVGQRNAGRKLGEFVGRVVRKRGDRLIADHHADIVGSERLLGQQHFQCRHVRIAGKSAAHIGDPLFDQHKRHVEAFDVRTGSPIEKRDQQCRPLEAHPARLTFREQKGRLIDDEREALPPVVRGNDG